VTGTGSQELGQELHTKSYSGTMMLLLLNDCLVAATVVLASPWSHSHVSQSLK
jgi:hypothetical protein